MRTKSMLLLGMTLILVKMTAAQDNHADETSKGFSSPLPDEPKNQTTRGLAAGFVPSLPQNDSYLSHAGVFCGIGASQSSVAIKPTVGCGAGFMFLPLPLFVEVGVMGPQANRSYLSGYVSLDGSIPLAPGSSKYLPTAILGYSRLFETGHALDYGLALAMPRIGHSHDQASSTRLELRDYWTFANPTQHNIMLRIGWMVDEVD